jgi:tetratricopeptide (TPR) repeat protein
LSLGGLHRQAGRVDSALAVYAEGLRHVQSAELYNNYGIQLVERGNLPDGIRAYQQAVRVDPGYGPAYHNMGNAYRAERDISHAEAAYHRALKADPNLAESRHALGLLYLSQGRNQEAVRELEEAVKKRPGELGFEISLARGYVVAGNPARALETYDRILSSNPSLENLRSERDSLKKRLSGET